MNKFTRLLLRAPSPSSGKNWPTLRRAGYKRRHGIHRVQFLKQLSSLPEQSQIRTAQEELRSVLRNVERQNAIARFHKWRKSHTLFLVGIGTVLGAGLMSIGTYLFIESNPHLIERFVVDKTTRAFVNALSFENRKKVYLSLPEPNFPTLDTLFHKAIEEVEEQQKTEDNLTQNVSENRDTNESTEDQQQVLNMWSSMVSDMIDKAETNWLHMAKMAMREKLVEECAELVSIDEKLDSFREIMPPSVERNLLVEDALQDELKRNGFIGAETLEKNRPQQNEASCEILTKILINSISFFPGPMNELIIDLHSQGKTMLNLEAVDKMKKIFQSLSTQMQNYVLQTALSTTIGSLETLPRMGSVTPYELYVRAIDQGLIKPLRQDARITDDILSECKNIFLAVPPTVQARVLLKGILHPAANLINNQDISPAAEPELTTNENGGHGSLNAIGGPVSLYEDGQELTQEEAIRMEAQAEMVRDLLTAGGVVAVKLGQMLAEHPRMPGEYQRMLGSLREENVPMRIAQFWWNIPSAVKSQITRLGPLLGTGSVKQVHAASFQDKRRYAVAILREGVEDEALSSISALETSEEIGPVATRLGRLVFGEFDLFQEGEALNDFAKTPIGTNKLFRVVEVKHHSPRCLVEEIADGPSVAVVLSNPKSQEEMDRTKEILTEYHRAVFSAFINDGIIHSDIHLGNAVRADEGFVLFDVGQFERIGLPDTKALLWTLSSVSSKEAMKLLQNVAIAHLTSVCSLTQTKHDKVQDETWDVYVKAKGENKPKEMSKRLRRSVTRISESKVKSIIRKRLVDAYEEATTPDENGDVPEPKICYILFLRAAEKRGVEMPKGAFAVAKMIDCILSQQDQYTLFPVVDGCIETFLRENMTWRETADILKKKYF